MLRIAKKDNAKEDPKAQGKEQPKDSSPKPKETPKPEAKGPVEGPPSPPEEEVPAEAADPIAVAGPDPSLAEKLPPQLVLYMGSEQGPFQCDHCRYWQAPIACTMVDGPIDPQGVCNIFNPAGDMGEAEAGPEMPMEGPEGPPEAPAGPPMMA
jgi:hypothetical protein